MHTHNAPIADATPYLLVVAVPENSEEQANSSSNYCLQEDYSAAVINVGAGRHNY